LRRSALLLDAFLSRFRAVAAIGPFAERGVSRLCIAVAMRGRMAEVSLANCVADADIHGRRITPAKRLQQQYMRIILNTKRYFVYALKRRAADIRPVVLASLVQLRFASAFAP